MRLAKAHVRAACFAALLAAAVVAMTSSMDTVGVRAQGAPITEDTLFQWVTQFSNWGRWGPDDQTGTHNFITPELKRKAARLVRSGISVPMGRRPFKVPFDPTQPFIPAFPSLAPKPTVPLPIDDTNPFFFWANPPSFTSDRWNVAAAGIVHSHLDAMCHTALAASTVTRGIFPQLLLYNGIPRSVNNTAAGCAKLGIEAVDEGVFTRGVLFDATLLPHLREGDNAWLTPGTRVTRLDLEMLEQIEHVKVRSGDVVLLYTGRWKRRGALGPWPPRCTTPGSAPPACGIAGFYADTIPFIFEREVAHMGHDAWVDVTPGGFDGFATLVYHGIDAALGMTHFDNLDLERLAETARELGRYDFLFTTAPFPVEGGITSILNPVAVF